MKVAMWAVFIFLMGVAGTVLINLFGNITTTNQQDYTLIRNDIEAAMYDSIDMASYRAGFYLCAKNGTYSIDSNKRMVFDDKNDYDIILNHNVQNSVLKTYANCDFLVGEVKLNADVFVESFLRRFANDVNNSKSYAITVQEVIEYPPKVSVRIDTYDTYNSQASKTETFVPNEQDFQIRNQVDAIFEEKIDTKK